MGSGSRIRHVGVGVDAVDLDEIVAESCGFRPGVEQIRGIQSRPIHPLSRRRAVATRPFPVELDYDALAEVAKRLTLERYQPGSFLFHRGGWARAIFIIEGGNVQPDRLGARGQAEHGSAESRRCNR